jgi:hypothetical protein
MCVLGAITFYGVWKLQGAMMNSEQYYNDPRHPRCTSPCPFDFLIRILLLCADLVRIDDGLLIV